MPDLLPDGSMVAPMTVVNPTNGRTAIAVARIDTGDDIALIDPSVANTLALVANGQTTVEGVSGQPVVTPLYTVDFNLGASGYASSVQVAGFPGLARVMGITLLAGDDLLNRGVLVRDGPGGFWSFTTAGGVAVPPGPNWWAIGAAVAGIGGGVALWHGIRRGR